MNGVDGKALLQKVRADLSVTRKQIDANDELESIEAFYGRQAYSYAYAAWQRPSTLFKVFLGLT